MGIFGFLFGKKKEERKAEEIKFDELETWIECRKEELRKQEGELIKTISLTIPNIIKNLEDGIKNIKNIDLSKKREEERIKVLVSEGLVKYSENIMELIKDLENVEKESLERIKKSIEKAVANFSKKSKSSLDKATIIIGKEIAEIEERIKIFFKDFNKILEDNRDDILKLKTISDTEIKIKAIKQIKEQQAEINDTLKNMENKRLEFENRKLEILSDIENLKKSEQYSIILLKKEEAVKKKEEAREELNNLKSLIDFKYLERIFHNIEHNMNLIKKYQEDFNLILEDERLIDLVEEDKKAEIKRKLEKIRIAITDFEVILKEESILKPYELDLQKIESCIEDKELEILKDKKRLEKIKISVGEIKERIIEELRKINVNVLN